LQAGIGIVTLLHQAPLPLALLHQIMGIVVLTIAVVHAERLVPQRAAAIAAEPIGVSIPRGTA
jgi:cytochrome c oxidase assembly protein subunit 15